MAQIIMKHWKLLKKLFSVDIFVRAAKFRLRFFHKPSGFVLGEELNDETFALHFAKGIREYKGIYQHLYNSFSIKLNSKYKYINFEQDLGKDTLRQAKSTYYPDEMRKKYRVALIK